MLLSIEALLNNDTSLKQIKQAAAAINGNFLISPNRIESQTIIAAYALYKVRTSNDPFCNDYQSLIDNKFNIPESLLSAITHTISGDMWTELSSLLPIFAADIFGAITFLPLDNSRHSGYDAKPTPNSILKLANSILQCKKEDRIADICCRTGEFIIQAAKIEPELKFVGYDANVTSTNIAKIRSELFGVDAQIVLQDVFSLFETEKGRFDKIFSNYPFALSLRHSESSYSFFKILTPKIPRSSSADWFFNLLLSNLISDKGKAIGIMSVNCTWNTPDQKIRKYFIENGLVEAVITLPPGIFDYISIPTSLIVLSHNNKSVRLVDATNIYHGFKRNIEFNDEDIETIINALTQDSEISKDISLDTLRANDYILNLATYTNIIEFENGVPFESVIKNIKRGAPISSKKLDELMTDTETDIQYIRLSNIHNGLIDEELPYLSELEPKLEKYCLNDKDIVLSKIGFPTKMAIISVPEGHKILASGNLFILEVDETKVSPYYLQALFNSEHGVNLLKSIIPEGALPNLSIDRLKKLQIPLPSLDTQNRIASKYQATVDEISVLKLKLQKATDRLHHIFDEEEVD